MSAQTESVRRLLADLHAKRLRTWDFRSLRTNIEQRRILEQTSNRAAFVKAGERLAPFGLKEVDHGPLDIQGCLTRGPLVLTFFLFRTLPCLHRGSGLL